MGDAATRRKGPSGQVNGPAVRPQRRAHLRGRPIGTPGQQHRGEARRLRRRRGRARERAAAATGSGTARRLPVCGSPRRRTSSSPAAVPRGPPCRDGDSAPSPGNGTLPRPGAILQFASQNGQVKRPRRPAARPDPCRVNVPRLRLEPHRRTAMARTLHGLGVRRLPIRRQVAHRKFVDAPGRQHIPPTAFRLPRALSDCPSGPAPIACQPSPPSRKGPPQWRWRCCRRRRKTKRRPHCRPSPSTRPSGPDALRRRRRRRSTSA